MHGPAVQLNVYLKQTPMIKLLPSVDPVPCSHIMKKYFRSPNATTDGKWLQNRELLWKQSIAKQEKQRLQYKDRDD